MSVQRDFDTSKWDKIDSSSDEEGQKQQRAQEVAAALWHGDDGVQAVTTSAAQAQLRACAAEYGIDDEILSDMLTQFDGDASKTTEYMRDFFGMEASSCVPAGAGAAAALGPTASVAATAAVAPVRRDFDSSKWDNIDTSSDEDVQAEQKHGQGQGRQEAASLHGISHGTAGSAPPPVVPAAIHQEQDMMRRGQLREEIAYADGQIADMREKHRSNDAALVALKHLADSRPAAVQQRANRQWVNMGDLFLKLPHKDVEGMLRTDQATLGDDIKELAKLKAQCQAQLTGSGADFRPGI